LEVYDEEEDEAGDVVLWDVIDAGTWWSWRWI
jgi:hypothetical protein